MNCQRGMFLALAAAMLLSAGAAAADQTKPTAKPAATSTAGKAAAPVGTGGQAAPARLVPPVRGVANVGVMRPISKRETSGGQTFIVTKIQLKNLSPNPIAGLKVEEYWFDKQGNPLPGDTFRHKKPLQPEEVITAELRTPFDAKMSGNNYKFTHANGTINTKQVAKF